MDFAYTTSKLVEVEFAYTDNTCERGQFMVISVFIGFIDNK